MTSLSRRSVLTAAAGGAALAAVGPRAAYASTRREQVRAMAQAGAVGSLPDPSRPAGEPDPALPYEHIVVVMMENHSFDTYLGMLPQRGQPKADGFTFDGNGRPLNSNPVPGDKKGGRIRSFRMDSTCQGDVSQSWDATHTQIDGGRMDGFVGSTGGDANDTPMGYYDEEDLPFYYSLAKTFTLGNRYFCSAPCQTYPNRRFLIAGTASGDIATTSSSLDAYVPANGTILDQMSANGVSWVNYFTDLPGTAVIIDDVLKHPTNYQPVAEFFAAAAAGTLPSVSFVDPEFGVTSEVGADLHSGLDELLAKTPGLTIPGFVGANLDSAGGDEETPQNVANGQFFVNTVVDAVMNSPAWSKTLLIWTYDEHGGYYDHVPPPAAPAPDDVAPDLQTGDVAGTYGTYGVRVPAVVVSPWSKRNAVTNVVHDHTSIMATIEMKWNLPSLTRRDATATTLHDFVDFSKATFLDPPTLVAAQNPATTLASCSTADYHEQAFYPASATGGTSPTGRQTATTGTTSAAAAHGATVGSVAGDRAADPASGTLAFTGLDTAVPVAGAALVGAAALARWASRSAGPGDAGGDS